MEQIRLIDVFNSATTFGMLFAIVLGIFYIIFRMDLESKNKTGKARR